MHNIRQYQVPLQKYMALTELQVGVSFTSISLPRNVLNQNMDLFYCLHLANLLYAETGV